MRGNPTGANIRECNDMFKTQQEVVDFLQQAVDNESTALEFLTDLLNCAKDWTLNQTVYKTFGWKLEQLFYDSKEFNR